MYSKTYFFITALLLLVTPLTAEKEDAKLEIPQPPAVAVEVSESELIELVGYLTAQSGGVPTLQLSEADLDSMADGLHKCLSGELNIAEFAQEDMEAAFGEAQARAEALESEASEIPAISSASLEKIGVVIVMQSGLGQLGFGAGEADSIRKGFVLGALAQAPDASLEAKMPAFQEFIQARIQIAQAGMQAEMQAAQNSAMVDFQDTADQWRTRENFNIVLETTQGEIIIELMPSVAPLAVANFAGHIENGYYNGLIFHRIIKDFMIQGGDPRGTGTGGESIWKKNFPDEFSEELRFDAEGMLAMANSGPMTNGSQFFITTSRPEWLNDKHTIFGKVVKGYDIVKKIEATETGPQDKPVQEQKILKAYIAE
jgi:peptidylprolyl isomerase